MVLSNIVFSRLDPSQGITVALSYSKSMIVTHHLITERVGTNKEKQLDNVIDPMR